MKYLVFAFIISYLPSALSKSGRIFTCPVTGCTDCSLEINLNTEKTEYLDHESEHILKMISVDDKIRVFEEPRIKNSGSPRYKVIFNRAKKTASLFSLMNDQSEKEIFKKAKCRLSTKAHNPNF